MLIGIVLLIATALFVFYRNPQQWSMFRSWFRPADSPQAPPSDIKQNDNKSRTEDSDSLGINSNPVTDNSRSPSSASESTPKARPQNGLPVPQFSLQDGSDSEPEDDNLPPPQFPALNSAQRASGTSYGVTVPRLNQGQVQNGSKGLMPPSTGPSTSRLMAPPSLPGSLNSLRIPPNRPLPNRGPPAGLSASLVPGFSAPAIPNPRKKVLLAPGHSPMDWANLQRSHSNLSGVSKLMRVTPSLLKTQNGRKGKPAWASYQGKVYNMSPYVPYHPGGEGEIRRAAGKDGEKLFMETHPWVNWDNMLGQCLVGILVSEHDPKADDLHEMESID